MLTLHTYALGKVRLLTVSLGKVHFSSVTNFCLGNLPGLNFIAWSLDMSQEQEFPLTATPKRKQGQIQLTNRHSLANSLMREPEICDAVKVTLYF